MTRLTRRSMLGALPALGLAAPGFAQTALAQTADLKGALPKVPGDVAPDYVVDTWLDIYGRPTIGVMVNGHGPFRFLVDTGSATSVIAARHVAALEAEPLGDVTVIGATGSAVMPRVELARLQAGVVEKPDLPVAVLPDRILKKEDGILGSDVFAGRRVAFDIPGKTVSLEPSKRLEPTSPPSNMRIRNGLLAEIEGRVGTITTRLMLDTGAKSCIANNALNAALLKRYPRQVRANNARIYGVTGQGVEGQLVFLPKVDMRAFTVEDASCIAADAPIFDLWGLNSEPAMIVGVDLLSRLASFSIDYGARTFDARLLAELVARNPVSFS